MKPDPDPRAKIEILKQAGVALKLLILASVSAGVGFLLGGMVNVSFENNPIAWAYQWGVVLALIGFVVWATAKILGLPPPSDPTKGP